MTLRELRISKGFNQEEASKICGVPLRTYKRYENDKKYLNLFKYNQFYNLINKPKKTKQNKLRFFKILITAAHLAAPITLGAVTTSCAPIKKDVPEISTPSIPTFNYDFSDAPLDENYKNIDFNLDEFMNINEIKKVKNLFENNYHFS